MATIDDYSSGSDSDGEDFSMPSKAQILKTMNQNDDDYLYEEETNYKENDDDDYVAGTGNDEYDGTGGANENGDGDEDGDGDGDGDDDIDEDVYEDEEEFKKLKARSDYDYIQEFHPECIAINNDEVRSMLNVIKDDRGNIVDKLHTTIPILTKYEKTRILGLRVVQLNNNSPPLISIPNDSLSKIIENDIIANMELNSKKLPFIIARPMPNGGFEYWRLSDLQILTND
jgi:DNA-directed RNA polymerase I, II, and III subunit RPABC2